MTMLTGTLYSVTCPLYGCTAAYTGQVIFTKHQKNTVMFNWSPCSCINKYRLRMFEMLSDMTFGVILTSNTITLRTQRIYSMRKHTGRKEEQGRIHRSGLNNENKKYLYKKLK